MVPWILAFLVIPLIQFLPKEKPLHPSYGILKYGDRYFESWSASLVKATILENNRLTSSKAKCANALDPIFGHCLHLNNMENDAKTLIDLASLSPFHIFSYTLIRRCLEIITLYFVRWLPLGSLFGLLASTCALIWIYFSKKWKPKEVKTATKGVSENWLWILLVFLCSTAVWFSLLAPFGLELVVGGIIESQLEGIFKDDLHRFLLEKVFFQNNSRSTVYDLFYFYNLRKTLFDLEKSEMKRSVPRNTEERLLLQMKLSLMNVTSFLVFAMVYLVIILICCLFIRMIIRRLATMLNYRNTNYCYKKVLKPGLKKPWKELDFATTIEPSNRKDKVKGKKSSHPADKMQVVLARSLQRKDDETPIEEEENDPDSNRGFVVEPPQKQPSRHSSKISVKETEIIKPFAKESHPGLPAVNNRRKTENKTSQPEYVDVGTHVCFDSEGSSDHSDFEFFGY